MFQYFNTAIYMSNMKNAAKTIKEALLKVDFVLQDKFCDAVEIKHSWSTIRIPHELIWGLEFSS